MDSVVQIVTNQVRGHTGDAGASWESVNHSPGKLQEVHHAIQPRNPVDCLFIRASAMVSIYME